MPAVAEAPPRSIDDYERWFDKVGQRFYRKELRDLVYAADIFHFFRHYKDGEAGISVIRRYGKDHKVHRVSFQLSPQDIANSQTTTPDMSPEHKELLELLSGPKGIQVTIDLEKVTTRRPLGFELKLSPAAEEGAPFVSQLITVPIIFDRESKEGESFELEKVMSLSSPYRNYGELMRRCGQTHMYAHENPQLVEFLKTTAFWMQKVISRRL